MFLGPKSGPQSDGGVSVHTHECAGTGARRHTCVYGCGCRCVHAGTCVYVSVDAGVCMHTQAHTTCVLTVWAPAGLPCLYTHAGPGQAARTGCQRTGQLCGRPSSGFRVSAQCLQDSGRFLKETSSVWKRGAKGGLALLLANW